MKLLFSMHIEPPAQLVLMRTTKLRITYAGLARSGTRIIWVGELRLPHT